MVTNQRLQFNKIFTKIIICILLCGLVWLLDIPDILSRFRGAYGNFPENKLQKMNRHVFGRLGYCVAIFFIKEWNDVHV